LEISTFFFVVVLLHHPPPSSIGLSQPGAPRAFLGVVLGIPFGWVRISCLLRRFLEVHCKFSVCWVLFSVLVLQRWVWCGIAARFGWITGGRCAIEG
jgi:hypothetical protein